MRYNRLLEHFAQYLAELTQCVVWFKSLSLNYSLLFMEAVINSQNSIITEILNRGWKLPNPPTGEPLSTYTAYHYFPPKIFFYTNTSTYHYILFLQKYSLTKIFTQNSEAQDYFHSFLFNFQTERQLPHSFSCAFFFLDLIPLFDEAESLVMEFIEISWQSPKM